MPSWMRAAAALYAFERFAMLLFLFFLVTVVVNVPRAALPLLWVFCLGLYGDAHAAGGAGDDLRCCVNVVGVQVGHLLLGDLVESVL